MPISYKSRLASEFFHFHVKYHVATNMLVTIWYTLSIRHDIKGNLDILHFLGDYIVPECVTILIIGLMIFGNFLDYFNSKLVGLIQIYGL